MEAKKHIALTYRPLRRSDLDLRMKWLNDPDTNRYLGTFVRKGTDRRFHQEWMTTYFRDRARKIFTASVKGRPIGQVGLLHINRHDHNAELYVVIGEKEFRGLGLGEQMVRYITRYGFDVLHLHRIYLSVHAGNMPAIRCYDRCGFVREGVLKDSVYREGSYEDEVIMSLTDPNGRGKL